MEDARVTNAVFHSLQKYLANFIFQNDCLADACGHADVIIVGFNVC